MLSDIIWDFDGTLFDTYPETVNAFIKALKDNGIDETSENIVSYVKISEGCAVKYFSELYGLGDTFIAESLRAGRFINQIQMSILAAEWMQMKE